MAIDAANSPRPLIHGASRMAPLIGSPLLAAALTSACYIAGPTLALFFGGVISIAIILPAMNIALDRWIDRLIIAAATWAAVVAAWIPATSHGWISVAQLGDCAALLLGFAVSLCGISAALRRMRIAAVPTSAITTVLALLWLSWPIWLSPLATEHQRLVDWLVPVHPLLAINGELIDLNIWTERPLMYRWTALNQDVSYVMPTTVLWCAIVHGLVGVGLMLLGAIRPSLPANLETS